MQRELVAAVVEDPGASTSVSYILDEFHGPFRSYSWDNYALASPGAGGSRNGAYMQGLNID